MCSVVSFYFLCFISPISDFLQSGSGNGSSQKSISLTELGKAAAAQSSSSLLSSPSSNLSFTARIQRTGKEWGSRGRQSPRKSFSFVGEALGRSLRCISAKQTMIDVSSMQWARSNQQSETPHNL